MENTKNSFVQNAFILFVASIVAKFFGMFYKIPLLKILGSEGLGLYQMVYPIFAFFVVLCSNGVVVALSKSIARQNLICAKQREKQFLKAGFFVSIVTSALLSALFCAITPYFVKRQNQPELFLCYFAILPSILLSGINAVFRGYFFGKNKMSYAGIVQVVAQISKLVSSLFFAGMLSKNGTAMAVCGAMIGISFSEFLSSVIFAILFLKRSKTNFLAIVKQKNFAILPNKKQILMQKSFHSTARSIGFGQAVKQIFLTSFFASVEASIIPLVCAVDSILIVPLLTNAGLTNVVATSAYGLSSGIVSSIIAMPTIIANSLSSAIIPSLQSKSDQQVIQNNASLALKIVWICSVACMTVFLFFPKELVSLLYSGGLGDKIFDELRISADLLRVNAPNVVYLCMLTISTSVLQGLGKSQIPAINLSICALIRTLFLFLLLKNDSTNIYGIAIADGILYSTAFLLNMVAIKKVVNVGFGFFKTIVLPSVALLAMGIAIGFFDKVISTFVQQKISTILAFSLGAITYFAFLTLTKVLDIQQVKLFLKNRREGKH